MGAMTPFDGVSAKESGGSSSTRKMLVGLFSVVALLGVILGGMLIWKKTVQNPYRTLEMFSAEKYFESPNALVGNRFQAILRVEGDLGWTSGVGKLMVFSMDRDPRYIPVLVPDDASLPVFSKGQTYTAQIRVQEGGLLHATDFKKN